MFQVISDKKGLTKQKWTQLERAIQIMVLANDEWACRAALALFELQTPEEQAEEKTVDLNYKGLSSTDAEFFSGIAKRLLDKKNISYSQLESVRQRTLKYRGQLAKLVVKIRGQEYARRLVKTLVGGGMNDKQAKV